MSMRYIECPETGEDIDILRCRKEALEALYEKLPEDSKERSCIDFYQYNLGGIYYDDSSVEYELGIMSLDCEIACEEECRENEK